MRPLALRIASVLTLFLTLAHTRGFMVPSKDAAQFATRKVMEANAFRVADATRTYWDLYAGFGLIISTLLSMQAVLLWIVAGAEKRRPGEQRLLIATLLVGNLVVLVLDWRFLFLAPVAVTALISAAMGVALWPRRAAPPPATA